MSSIAERLDTSEIRQAASMNLARPLKNTRVLVSMLLLGTVGLVIGLIKTPWQQTATGYGRVVAFSPDERIQTLDAPLSGRIHRWFVQEGDSVEKGDPIVEIRDIDPGIMDRLQREQDAVQKRLNAAKLQAETAQLNVERQEKAVAKGLSAPREFEKARMEWAKFLSDEAKAAEDLAKVEVRLSRQGAQLVTAPSAGRIQRRMAGEGGVLVSAGAPMATLVPETDSRAVELRIDGNDIPLVHKGDEVRIQFEGWPAVQISGWPSVAVGTFPARVEFVDAADSGGGGFRVLVTPRDREDWPEGHYLRQGTRAQGWVLLNEVKLWFELWRRFNGFPVSLPARPDMSEPTKSNKRETPKEAGG